MRKLSVERFEVRRFQPDSGKAAKGARRVKRPWKAPRCVGQGRERGVTQGPTGSGSVAGGGAAVGVTCASAACLACLRRARDAARAEGLVSDYWFPSEGSNNRPVANVDRAWFAALDELGWPHLSLAKTARCIRQRWLLWSGLPNHAARQSVRIELAGWGLKVS